jgi:hypothetical protein
VRPQVGACIQLNEANNDGGLRTEGLFLKLSFRSRAQKTAHDLPGGVRAIVPPWLPGGISLDSRHQARCANAHYSLFGVHGGLVGAAESLGWGETCRFRSKKLKI